MVKIRDKRWLDEKQTFFYTCTLSRLLPFSDKKEQFEDTKGVITRRKSWKDRQTLHGKLDWTRRTKK